MFELTEGCKDRLELTDYQNRAEYDRLKKLFLDAIRAEFGSDIWEKYPDDETRPSREEMRQHKSYGAYVIQKRDGDLQDGDDIVRLSIGQAAACIKGVGGKVLVAGLIIKEGTQSIPVDENGEACEEEASKNMMILPIYTVGWKVHIKH
jgi:hypothetical protein